MRRAPFALSALAPLLLLLPACGPDAAQSGADGGGSEGPDASTSDAGPEADALPETAQLELLLDQLRNDREGTMLAQSRAQGWPAPVEGGHLFVSTNGLSKVAGDHDQWVGTEMNAEDDFYWQVLEVQAGSRYKFTDGSTWQADFWSRSYAWDDEGEMSMLAPSSSHLERHFQVGDAEMQDRTVRIWVPEQSATHVLYVHDGQNLFNPGAFFGGWHLNDNAPEALMMVGIDNTAARMDEYTHAPDDLGGGPIGGRGDAYADFINTSVRGLVETHYGEAAKVGTMGSSLGGLISLHIVDRFPGEYDFAASLSGTVGWGSLGSTGTDTIIARYAAAGHRGTALYIDSGGNGSTCADSDGDGTNDDDPSDSDNYCTNRQLEAVLVAAGYTYDVDMWHWWETDAPHNEQAWAARVFRPLQDFMSL